MSGFDILTLIGEPWNDSSSVFGGISVSVNDMASFPSSKFLELFLNGSSVYRILKTGETVISSPTGNSLGGMRLAGDGGLMALTSQMDLATGQPAQVMSYFWENPAEVGYNPHSEAVLQGMGSSRFSVKSQATFAHTAGNSRYEWQGVLGPRIQWTGLAAASNAGMTIDFTNVGQSPRRASPVVSFSGANAADDLVHFGLSDGINWNPRARIDAYGRAQFQILDLPEQSVPGDPGAATARLYALKVDGVTRLAFRDSSGAETVLGQTGVVSTARTASASKVAGGEGSESSAALEGQPSPADLTVGGVSGQVQYNNDGALAGLTGITVTAGAASAIALTSGTTTVSKAVISVTQTWNSPTTVFHPVDINITDNGSDYTSSFFRARVNGVDQFSVARDQTMMFGAYTGTPLGFRRLGDRVLGICSLLSNTSGRLAPVISVYWEKPPLPNGRANEDVAVIHGFGSNRLSIESASSIVHIAETGRYEWEVGYTSGNGRISWVGYEKASSTGRTFDFNNYGQAEPRADPIISFSSDVEDCDLVHFSKYNGSLWDVRGKVDVKGRAMFQMLDLPEQSDPGNPAEDSGRLYTRDADGVTRLAFRTAAGVETLLGAGVATAETIVPDSTIILYDAAGNAYKVPCIAV